MTMFMVHSGNFDVNTRNDRGWTALMLAARNGHVNVVKELLQHR